ncbi:MAG: TrlF family AAA-like ATPase [Candidatus Heimdallarchaeota archaeon]
MQFDFLADKKVLTRANIEEVGRHLKDSDQDLQGKSDFKTGCIHISIPLDNIISVLKKQKQLFEGRYILVLPDDSWSEINWRSHGRTKRAELYAKSHAMFASNPNTINWALGKLEQGPQNLPPEFRSFKPCFHGSDSHDFERLCKPDLDRFCWIKADRTFEGLKQVIYEPEERVRIQTDNPEPRKNIWTLSSTKISNSQINRDLAIAEQEILLNRNLLAVIGGKGTGKTALLELIAHCFEERRKSGGKDKNSFIQRIEDEKSDLAISIDFLEEEQFSKEIGEPEFFLKSKTTYLPQGRIEAYSGNRQKLHGIITDTIFYDRRIRETPLKEKYEHLQKQVESLGEKLRTLTAQIIALEDQVDPSLRSQIEKAWKFSEGARRNKLFELGELEKELKTDLRSKVKELRLEETKLVSNERKLREVLGRLNDYLKYIEEMRSRETEILKLAQDLQRFDIHVQIPSLQFEFHQSAANEALKAIEDKLTAIQIKVIEQRSAISQLAGFEEEYDNLRKEISKIEAKIEDLAAKRKELDKKTKMLTNLEGERIDIFILLMKRLCDLKAAYEEIIKKFSKGKDEILRNIDFQPIIVFDEEKFVFKGEDILDGRAYSRHQLLGLARKLKKILDDSEAIESKAKAFLRTITKIKSHLKKTRSSLDFYNWIFSRYFSLSTDIFFKKTHMDNLSIGQKGTVLLKILLAESDHPLILDQPEENLDNKFIYEDLVKAIRQAKKNRQILIATHNANLVVNTDAEQVIIADFQNKVISYNTGTGGKEAFKKREEKYEI